MFSTPELFMMGRPIVKSDDGLMVELALDPSHEFIGFDCWLVWLCAGNLLEALRLTPFRLPWIAFQRNNKLRFLRADKLYAKIASMAARRNSLLQGRRPCPQAAETSDADYGC